MKLKKPKSSLPNFNWRKANRDDLVHFLADRRPKDWDAKEMSIDELRNACRMELIKAWDAEALYNAPESLNPDYSKWLKKEFWHIDQALILSLEKNPDSFGHESAVAMRKICRREFSSTTGFLINYFIRLRNLKRALAAKHLKQPLTPEAFINWAHDEEFKLPDQFISPNKRESEERKTKTVNVLYSLLLAVAIQYDKEIGSNDPAKGSIVPSWISFDLSEIGVFVGRQAIQQHLAKAVAWAKQQELELKQLKLPTQSDNVVKGQPAREPSRYIRRR